MKYKYYVMLLVCILVLAGCDDVSNELAGTTELSIETEDVAVNTISTEETEELFVTMDSSMKEETCTISAKAIETVDHHGNPLLIMRTEDEDYLNPEEGFAVLEISDELKGLMVGTSWREGCPVSLDDLRYVQVLYKGFDKNSHIGGLIVHVQIAEEVMDIFKELYDGNFPIEKIRPIYHYSADDDKSMDDNNTSSFNYRVVEGTSKLSKHSFGIAVDINPIQNPYVSGGHISPESGSEFVDRKQLQAGMIIEGDNSYNAFVSRGWTWGGHWNTMKDYQHFQKKMDIESLKSNQ